MGSALCHTHEGRAYAADYHGHSDPASCCADQERQVQTDERVSAVLRVKRGQLEACSVIGAVQEIGGVERPPIVACTRTCLQCQNA